MVLTKVVSMVVMLALSLDSTMAEEWVVSSVELKAAG